MQTPPPGRGGAADEIENTGTHLSFIRTAAGRQRLQRAAARLHALGPRAVYEFLAEIIAANGDVVLDRLEDYARLDPTMLRALGGDKFPARPLRRVA